MASFLDDIISNTEVSESAVSALVGSLESQLNSSTSNASAADGFVASNPAAVTHCAPAPAPPPQQQQQPNNNQIHLPNNTTLQSLPNGGISQNATTGHYASSFLSSNSTVLSSL